MPGSRPTAVFITTFDAEFLAVTEHLEESPQQLEQREERGTLYELGTFRGDHATWTVAVAEIGPGNSTAAAEVERANAAFAPDVVLLVGVAGGLSDLRLGDVVAADAVYDYESGKDADDEYLPRIKTQPSSHRLLQYSRQVARSGDWHRRIRPVAPATPPRAVVRPIAAGGKLVAGTRSRTAELLRRYCSDAGAVEMEGSGFLRGAYLNHGVEALVVRGVSDLLNDKRPIHDAFWQPTAARHAAAFAFAVLSGIKIQGAARRESPPADLGSPGPKFRTGNITAVTSVVGDNATINN
jgi:adenosylhomocysteine nucleosidase